MAGPAGRGPEGELHALCSRAQPFLPAQQPLSSTPRRRASDRHGFMATLQPWPMSLARPVPTVRRMWQPRIAPGRMIAPIMRTTWGQRLLSDQREVLTNEGGRGEIMRGSCRSREGMRETPSRCLKSCPGPRLAVAGNSPAATRSMWAGFRSTRAARRRCKSSGMGL